MFKKTFKIDLSHSILRQPSIAGYGYSLIRNGLIWVVLLLDYSDTNVVRLCVSVAGEPENYGWIKKADDWNYMDLL